MKVRWFLVANLVLLLALALWAFARLDWPAVARNLSSASLTKILMMAAVWLAALFVRPLRLTLLVQTMSPEVGRRYWPIWASDMIAVAVNSVIPLRAGDMTMALVMRQSIGLSTARGFSAVFVDRFFDLLTVVVLFYVALSVAPTVAPWATTLSLTLPIGLVVLVGILWAAVGLHQFWTAIIDRLLARAPIGRRAKWSERLRELVEGLGAVNRPGVMVPAVMLSVLLWGLTSTSYWLAVNAVWPQAPFGAGAFAASAVALSFVVPSTPAGVGVFHAVAVVAFSLFHVPVEAALAAAIVCHALMLGLILILAGIALVYHGLNVRSLTRLRNESS
jgi:glycosyltransferase 2 family protein